MSYLEFSAFMSPMFPYWIRSSKGRPRPPYFLATQTASRRFCHLAPQASSDTSAKGLFDEAASTTSLITLEAIEKSFLKRAC
jgi:hypothetical protein